MTDKLSRTFHGYSATIGAVSAVAEPARDLIVNQDWSVTYRFYLHFHPYVAALTKRLVGGSLGDLQDADTPKKKPELYQEFFEDRYQPDETMVPRWIEGSDEIAHPVKDLDFTPGGAYSVYNWEIFFHAPLAVAVHLSKNQRFEEAQRWFHYVFDPTTDSAGEGPERFWKVKPLQTADVKRIEELLINLSTGADPELQKLTVESVQDWKDNPFHPHAVARHRQTAYMWKTVMAYLDNLIDWGDSLFRQDTGESINEATQLYILAANILGPRPEAVPKKGSVRPRTYAELRKKGIDEFGDALVDLETEIPFDKLPYPAKVSKANGLSILAGLATAAHPAPQTLATGGEASKTLYFCVPRNDKLLAYWDTVGDRLFKIRNSLNFQGIFRQLPLFDPPIDPAMLVRAAAAGLDVGAVVNGLHQPLPLVRFQLLLQKALEICQEVKSLGGQVLAAMEKEDNERLAILRAGHERAILQLVESVKYAQWQEAIKSREGLLLSLANAAQRYTYYERQLGKKENEIKLPELEALDADGLWKMKLRAGEPVLSPRPLEVDIAGDERLDGGTKTSSHEIEELRLLHRARDGQIDAATLELLAMEASLVPQFDANVEPLGVGVSTGFGGVQISKMLSLTASATRITADQFSYEANRAAKIGSYARREQEWTFQSNVVAGEITQIYKQIRAAQIREAIAQREWENHKKQIKNAQEIEDFLTDEKTGKKTNRAFYAWMKREVKGLHSQCYQLAFDIAKKAERALQHELGDPTASYLQFGHLAGKEGLLAGEKLYLDIKRMEMAYHENNRREYELTKHVSLKEVAPLALLELRATGRCTVLLPEELFDMDGPGHYFRRIKSVAVSIPCVAGPYASVNCTLTLQKSSIRRSALLDGSSATSPYARSISEEDARFSDHFGSMQSIVTSTAQNDPGLFEANLRDERYLPFEGSGVISSWQVALPANPAAGDLQQFGYDTISDVILHLRYTAREGGMALRNGAMANLKDLVKASGAVGTTRVLSVRHELPTEWAKLRNTPVGGPAQMFALGVDLRAEHYPFWSRVPVLSRVRLLAMGVEDLTVHGPPGSAVQAVSFAPVEALGGHLSGDVKGLLSPLGKSTLYLNRNTMKDIWMIIEWYEDAK